MSEDTNNIPQWILHQEQDGKKLEYMWVDEETVHLRELDSSGKIIRTNTQYHSKELPRGFTFKCKTYCSDCGICGYW